MIYITCKYAPMELFEGFGEDVERLDPNPVSFSCADGCGHPNLCGFAKAVIEETVRRDIRNLIFTDCCDAMRRTFDALDARGLDFLYMLPLPHRRGEREIALFAHSLRSLAQAYAERSGKVFDEKRAVAACLSRRRPSSDAAGERTAGNRLSFRGAHGGAALLSDVRKTFPGMEVLDETCSGERLFSEELFHGPSGERPFSREAFNGPSGEDFFVWYARLLLTGQVSCLRMGEVDDRERLLEGQVRGIVYHTIKFCDYYSFEYTELKDKTKLPLLKIETDTTPQSSGQLHTRLEAFAETLGVQAAKSTGKPKNECRSRTDVPGGDRFCFRQPQLPNLQNRHPNPICQDRTDIVRGERTDMTQTSGNREKADIYAAGVDSGSTSTDVVILDASRKILGQAILPTGMSAAQSAEKALEEALKQAGLSREDLTVVVTTGYGRESIGMEGSSVTEITCHARGAHFLFPEARTIIDIGGQDSKVIRVDENGSVENFIMNDKCAAGTGRFLEMQARALSLSMEEMSRLGLSWKKEIHISNMCTVFAESEVVSLVAKNEAVSDIIHGLNESVAAKTVSLVSRGKGRPGYCMTGGVSRNAGVVQCLGQKLGEKIRISDQSQLCGAIGAALIGLDRES